MSQQGAQPAAYYTGNRRFSIEGVEPAEPGPGEVRVAVAYCGICGTDLHVYLGHMDQRIGDHRVIGHEMSGTVEALGDGVDTVAPGDRVVARPLGRSTTSRRTSPRSAPTSTSSSTTRAPSAAPRPPSTPTRSGTRSSR